MPGPLHALFHRWEMSIFARDAGDRRPQAFDWGLEFLDGIVDGASGEAPETLLPRLATELCAASDEFYAVDPITEARLHGDRLTFASPLPAEDPEVRLASARVFDAAEDGGRAVVVIPQWNADEGSMVTACKILNRFGLSALRMTLPFHEDRRPPRMLRADAMVSPVIGLTLQSIRRAVLEVKQAVGWLRQEGYERIGLLGTSLGSCIGFLAVSHDPRIRAAAFNHVAGHFAEVVWGGLATRHVRASLDAHVDLETLRLCWAPISPARFVDKLEHRPGLLMISGAYDPIFLPEHASPLVDGLRGAGVPFRRVVLPCGHYTLGRPPFYLIDAYLVVRFLRRHLTAGSETNRQPAG